jgi:hypothetical protein
MKTPQTDLSGIPLRTAPPANRPEVVKFTDPSKDFITQKLQAKRATKSNSGSISESSTIITDNKALHRSTMHELEQLAASELKGNERRRYLAQKLESLGVYKRETNPNNTNKTLKPRVPWRIAAGMLKKSRERAKKEKQQIIETGDAVVYDSSNRSLIQRVKTANGKEEELSLTSMSHPLLPGIKKRLHKEKVRKSLGQDKRQWSERGMKSGVGKYKDGVLYLSKSDRQNLSTK